MTSMSERCEWSEDDDGVWETGCLNKFVFNDGGPPENDFEFCPYCGKQLKVHRYVTPNSDIEGKQ